MSVEKKVKTPEEPKEKKKLDRDVDEDDEIVVDTVDRQQQSAQEAEARETDDLNTRFLRLAADFQNFRRRVEKEKCEIYSFANENLVTELLPVIDNFDRALAVESADKGMRDGIMLVLKQFMDVLEKNGLEEIPAEGAEFDPRYHHAVVMGKDENKKSGQVIQVLQKGYLLKKKVIRPAMVKVAE